MRLAQRVYHPFSTYGPNRQTTQASTPNRRVLYKKGYPFSKGNGQNDKKGTDSQYKGFFGKISFGVFSWILHWAMIKNIRNILLFENTIAYRWSDSKPAQTRAQVSVKKEQGITFIDNLDYGGYHLTGRKNMPFCCSFLTLTNTLKQWPDLESDHLYAH